jgi:putative transposase
MNCAKGSSSAAGAAGAASAPEWLAGAVAPDETERTVLRAECLNAHVFESLEDAEETLNSWRSYYNAVRPHSALGMLTPREFAELGQRNAGR